MCSKEEGPSIHSDARGLVCPIIRSFLSANSNFSRVYMEHRPNIPGSQPHHSNSSGSNIPRRRSHSQPVPPPPIAGPSYRTTEQFDFSFQSPFGTSPELEYDEDLFRHFMSMSDDQHEHHQTAGFPSFPPPPPPPVPDQMSNQQGVNPLVTQTFLAWLQYVHLQNQLAQTQPSQSSQQQAQQPQIQPQTSLQQHQAQFPLSAQTGPPQTSQNIFQPSTSQSGPRVTAQAQVRTSPSVGASDTPSPDGGEPVEGESLAITEDKRRRNTAASARFRVKKKQWTLNLERSISDLSGRVEELEREAAELRRENGWLKEIVMLKSKRFGGSVPELGPNTSQSGSDSGSTEGPSTSVDRSGENDKDDDSTTSGKDKGKERAHS
ncbi:hypothetical protein QCA50_001446 [Cerrena zonata]|uniref:BZIP domain-containing protein n=1 Tax=Cerrena zonata TaxID=2478898 RepID=A0AAW0GLE8_9APHY